MYYCARFQTKIWNSFLSVPKKNHDSLLKNTKKMAGFNNNELVGRTLFIVFIVH